MKVKIYNKNEGLRGHWEKVEEVLSDAYIYISDRL